MEGASRSSVRGCGIAFERGTVTSFLAVNGDRYEGEFRHDRRHGHGVYRWANGDQYVGVSGALLNRALCRSPMIAGLGEWTSVRRRGENRFQWGSNRGNVQEWQSRGLLCEDLRHRGRRPLWNVRALAC
jgi:hypothetical protein